MLDAEFVFYEAAVLFTNTGCNLLFVFEFIFLLFSFNRRSRPFTEHHIIFFGDTVIVGSRERGVEVARLGEFSF